VLKHRRTIPEAAEASITRVIGSLPPGMVRRLAGRPVEVDGQVLEAEAQLAQRLVDSDDGSVALSVAERRAKIEHDARVFTGPRVEVADVRNLEIEGAAGLLPARLYAGQGARARSPLLVYFHGGGWTVGSLDTHDNLCRFLARDAGMRVLSVAYRLAPESRFPAAAEDALASFRGAVAEADALGADPHRIAVGGDSAGGNLAAVCCQLAAADGGTEPCFQLLIYPVAQLGGREHRSYELFGEGYYLTTAEMDWFDSMYLSDPSEADDPRASPLRARDLSGLPPALVVVAGFDPLRDEVVEYSERLREAGVEVEMQRVPGMPHGFANAVAAGRVAPAAMREVARSLARGLATT
jgi:acetyl esterase